MITKTLRSLLAIAAIMTLLSFDLPEGWFKSGSSPEKYEMGIDKGAGEKGENAATIKSINKHIMGFGTLMQECLPDKYIGKKIKLTGYMKSMNVKRWAGFWLRVDGGKDKEILSFDNMSDRGVSGTTDWKQYEIILDVPITASNIAYGALLAGPGQIWFDNLNIEIVGNASVGTIPKVAVHKALKEPTNMNFEK